MKKYIIFLTSLIVINSIVLSCFAKDIGYVKSIEMGVDSSGNNTSESTYTTITIDDDVQNTPINNDTNSYIYMNPYYGGLYYGTRLNGAYPYYYGYNGYGGYGITTFTVPGMFRNPPPPPPNKPGHHPNNPPQPGGNNRPPVQPSPSIPNNNFPHNHIPNIHR